MAYAMLTLDGHYSVTALHLPYHACYGMIARVIDARLARSNTWILAVTAGYHG